MVRNVLLPLLSAVVIFSLFSILKTTPVYAFSGGDGSSGNPYIITSCSELQGMQNDLSAHYKLGNNIDCSSTSTWNSGAGFVPIGDSSTKFTGNFDGANHSILHLFINSTVDYVGLFGYANGGTIANVSLTDIDITQSGNTPIVYLGGLVGYGLNITINKASTTGNITTTDSTNGSEVGGLIGYLHQGGSTITDSYSTCTINNSRDAGQANYVGGLVGVNEGTIQNSYASGTVAATGDNSTAGGLIGSNYDIVKNSFATGSVSGDIRVGGLVGYNDSGGSAFVTNSYSVNSTLIGLNMGTANGGSIGGVSLASFYQIDPLYAVYTNSPAWDFTDVWKFNDASSLPVFIMASSSLNNSSDGSSGGGSPSSPSCGNAAPTSAPNLFQVDVSSTKAILYFAPSSGSVNKYMISYGYTSGDNRFGVEFPQNQQSGVVAYAINNLSPNFTYYFRVRGGNGCMPGNWGNEIKITTTKSSKSAVSYYENFAQKLLASLPLGY